MRCYSSLHSMMLKCKCVIFFALQYCVVNINKYCYFCYLNLVYRMPSVFSIHVVRISELKIDGAVDDRTKKGKTVHKMDVVLLFTP